MSGFGERLIRLYEGEGKRNALSVIRRAFTLCEPLTESYFENVKIR